MNSSNSSSSIIGAEPVFTEVLALSVPSLEELDGEDPFKGIDLTNRDHDDVTAAVYGEIPYALTARGLAERVA